MVYNNISTCFLGLRSMYKKTMKDTYLFTVMIKSIHKNNKKSFH